MSVEKYQPASLVCPKCGQNCSFHVICSGTMTVYMAADGDIRDVNRMQPQITQTSQCTCPHCHHVDELEVFEKQKEINMADYYSDYVAKMKCPKDAAEDFCQLVRFANDCGDKSIPDWFVDEYGARTPDDVFKEFSKNGAMFSGITETEYDADKGIFSFSARKYANPQFLIEVLPKIMSHYDLKKPVAVEMAQTADKSCEDGFGGCVFVFGPNIWKAVGTRDMAAILKKEVLDIAKIQKPTISPEVLCWSGLTVANVKTEFPDLEDKLIHDFIVEHEDGICEAMNNAAMSYVINNMQERQNG